MYDNAENAQGGMAVGGGTVTNAETCITADAI